MTLIAKKIGFFNRQLVNQDLPFRMIFIFFDRAQITFIITKMIDLRSFLYNVMQSASALTIYCETVFASDDLL